MVVPRPRGLSFPVGFGLVLLGSSFFSVLEFSLRIHICTKKIGLDPVLSGFYDPFG